MMLVTVTNMLLTRFSNLCYTALSILFFVSLQVYENLYESPFHIEFLNLRRPHNDIDVAQLAC